MDLPRENRSSFEGYLTHSRPLAPPSPTPIDHLVTMWVEWNTQADLGSLIYFFPRRDASARETTQKRLHLSLITTHDGRHARKTVYGQFQYSCH